MRQSGRCPTAEIIRLAGFVDWHLFLQGITLLGFGVCNELAISPCPTYKFYEQFFVAIFQRASKIQSTIIIQSAAEVQLVSYHCINGIRHGGQL